MALERDYVVNKLNIIKLKFLKKKKENITEQVVRVYFSLHKRFSRRV